MGGWSIFLKDYALYMYVVLQYYIIYIIHIYIYMLYIYIELQIEPVLFYFSIRKQ